MSAFRFVKDVAILIWSWIMFVGYFALATMWLMIIVAIDYEGAKRDVRRK